MKISLKSALTYILQSLTTQKMQLTLTSSFTAYGSDNAGVPFFRRVGNVCYVVGTVKPTAAISGSTTRVAICQIPIKYAPKTRISQVCQGSGNARWLCELSVDGTINFSRYCNTANSANAYNSCGTDQWLPFSITWICDD